MTPRLYNSVAVGGDILPIFVLAVSGSAQEAVSFEGTGFLVAPQVLVTCWHCVKAELPPGQLYVVPVGPTLYELSRIEPDPSGLDLATATVEELRPTLDLRLASDADVLPGIDVTTFGYPADTVLALDERGKFNYSGRVLKGYIARRFHAAPTGPIVTPTLELDMLAPAGLSGAPLLIHGHNTNTVVGVLYGSHATATIEEIASVDPATGVRQPEIQRLATFGLAHTPLSLGALKGAATNYKPVSELLRA